MKTIVAGLLAAPLLLALDSSAGVAEVIRPWCAQYYGRGASTNCGFTSYQQCMMTAGPGTGAWCVRNPMYGSGASERAGRRTRSSR